MAQLLIVEDDAATNQAVCAYLTAQGHQTIPAYDGEEALTLFDRQSFDLVVLDIMLPKVTGLMVLRALREKSEVPVLMLTALSDEHIQVVSFDCRVDDYMTKPFSMVLLGRRVAGLLRRAQTPSGQKMFRFEDVTVDFEGYTASDSSGRIDITPKEISLLRLLLDHPGKVLARGQILDELWGEDYPILDRTIDTYVSNLRKKLRLWQIVTVKGVGYKFDEVRP